MENPLNTSAACESILGALISNPITGQMRDARWWVGFTKKKKRWWEEDGAWRASKIEWQVPKTN